MKSGIIEIEATFTARGFRLFVFTPSTIKLACEYEKTPAKINAIDNIDPYIANSFVSNNLER